METVQELHARIERTLQAKSATRAARPDLDLQAMPPAERRKEMRDRDVDDERFAIVSGGLPVLSKLMARLREWADERPQQTRQAMRDIEAEGAATQRRDVRDACDLALKYLRGEIRDGGGM